MIIADKPMKSIELDPYRETADIDRNNNYFPPVMESTKFQLFKMRRGFGGEDNPMGAAKAKREAEAKKAEAAKADADKAAKAEAAASEKKTEASPEAKPTDEPKKKKKKKKKEAAAL